MKTQLNYSVPSVPLCFPSEKLEPDVWLALRHSSAGASILLPLRQQFFQNSSWFDPGQALIEPLKLEGKAFVVDAQAVQQRGV